MSVSELLMDVLGAAEREVAAARDAFLCAVRDGSPDVYVLRRGYVAAVVARDAARDAVEARG